MPMPFPEFDHPMWPLLSQVSRPSRYTGSEWRVPLMPWDGTRLRLCLLFPDVYEIGMSYYGFQLLPSFIRSMGCLVDRAFCPWVDMERLLRHHELPLLSVEQEHPLSEFDALGVTLQHEMSYTNVLTMLSLGGVPLRSEERSDSDPLVMAGGPGALTPEPLAPFIDLFCVGEGEAMLPPLLELLSETLGQSREERLRACSALKGVYVPSLVRPRFGEDGVSFDSEASLPVVRQILDSFERAYCPDDLTVPSVGVVHDRAVLEIFRGCSRGCRFCQAGMVTRPVRERSPDEAVRALLEALDRTGWEEVALLSLASCDYGGLTQVLEALADPLKERGVKLSLPSLRMDGFSIALAERLQRVGRGGLTFAPEAGTQRLRNVINKGVTKEDVVKTLDEVFERGWDRVKLYFMMGLPTETVEDLDGIVDLAQAALKQARRKGRRRASLSVSVAGFVPKPHTPFQWERQNSVEELREKGRYLKQHISDRALSLKYHEPEQTFLEGVLARGDRRLADVIETAWRMGARFDSWTETFDLARWLKAFEACELDPEDLTRERRESEKLPWDVVDVGITRDFLLRERRRAYAALVTQDCRVGCAACGLNCHGGVA
ncbi:MAG: TIGR03960 family B12-binding radical SAM protein [Fretibacterium sp.]|nr:TIGR03960 family B12-binding radical SAM protein [Fretibacterium sp.]